MCVCLSAYISNMQFISYIYFFSKNPYIILKVEKFFLVDIIDDPRCGRSGVNTNKRSRLSYHLKTRSEKIYHIPSRNSLSVLPNKPWHVLYTVKVLFPSLCLCLSLSASARACEDGEDCVYMDLECLYPSFAAVLRTSSAFDVTLNNRKGIPVWQPYFRISYIHHYLSLHI